MILILHNRILLLFLLLISCLWWRQLHGGRVLFLIVHHAFLIDSRQTAIRSILRHMMAHLHEIRNLVISGWKHLTSRIQNSNVTSRILLSWFFLRCFHVGLTDSHIVWDHAVVDTVLLAICIASLWVFTCEFFWLDGQLERFIYIVEHWEILDLKVLLAWLVFHHPCLCDELIKHLTSLLFPLLVVSLLVLILGVYHGFIVGCNIDYLLTFWGPIVKERWNLPRHIYLTWFEIEKLLSQALIFHCLVHLLDTWMRCVELRWIIICLL